jgi:cell wall-associated NlpC family hydrolase
MNIVANHIVAEARTYLGVRWQHQGRTRHGVDCIGLVIKTAHGLGLSEFDVSDYAAQAMDESLLAGCRQHLVEIMAADAAPGDVLVMVFANQRHIGIVGDYCHGGLSLIHACALHPRKVVEVRLDAEWRARVRGTFRFPQVVACS